MSAPSPRLDEQLCFALYTASRLTIRAYGPMLAELGLTYPQYLTMLALWESGEPMTVGELGGRLHLETGTLTPLLKRLEAAGLITRLRDGADERRVLIAVTPAGADLQGQACDIPSRIADRFGGDADQVTALRQVLGQLIETLDR